MACHVHPSIAQRHLPNGRSTADLHCGAGMQEVALSPWMFTDKFPKDAFQKAGQWVSLSRAAAHAAVHDRIVEPWFATFAGSVWRCAAVDEGERMLDGVAALRQQGTAVKEHPEALRAQLQAAGYLPRPFRQGARRTVFGAVCVLQWPRSRAARRGD